VGLWEREVRRQKGTVGIWEKKKATEQYAGTCWREIANRKERREQNKAGRGKK